jgi:2'-5' RNA ligase
MAVIGIAINHETARLIQEIKCPGNRVDSSTLHVTLLCLGQNIPIKTLSKAICGAYEVFKETEPFWLKISSVSCFATTQEGQMSPIIAPIISPTLQKLHSSLKREMRKEKVDYDVKYKYRPHVTLSYNDGAIKKAKIEPIEWSVQEVILWGSEEGDKKIFTVFPLSLRNEAVKCEEKTD